MNVDRTVGAVFYDSSDPSQYFRVYLNGETQNGKVMWSVNNGIPALLTTAGVTFPAGTGVYLEAVADEGFKFSYWTDSGAAGNSTRTHTSSNDLGINAIFVTIATGGLLSGPTIWALILLTALATLAFLWVLSRMRYRVEGTITYKDEGLKGVTVEYTMNGKAGTAVTDSNGRYAIRALAGCEIVIKDVAKDGYKVHGRMPKQFITEKTSVGVNFEMDMVPK
jgi:hypothetical protein